MARRRQAHRPNIESRSVRRRPAGVVTLFVASLLLVWPREIGRSHAECALEPAGAAVVSAVRDGETLILADGREVRLIGALAPHAPLTASTTPAAPWQPEIEARRFLTELSEGRNVTLAFAGRRTDRYGKLLAHVFLEGPAGSTWLQAEMLSAGHARAYALPGNQGCLKDLVGYEAYAREASVALWSNASYAVIPALDLRALARARNTFQIVEGRVDSTQPAGQRTLLLFSADRRAAFSVGLPAGTTAIDGLPPSALVGRTVRVRGWIDRRGSPYLEAVTAEAIEVLPKASEPDVTAAPPRTRRSRANRQSVERAPSGPPPQAPPQ